MFYFRYPVEGGVDDDYLPVATTRPETILGDTAVAVHPEDPRFAKFLGKRCRVPLTDRSAPALPRPSFPGPSPAQANAHLFPSVIFCGRARICAGRGFLRQSVY